MATRKRTAAVSAAMPGSDGSYLEWGPVWGGGAVAVALSLVLMQFGAGIGLSVGDPVLESGAVSWNVLAAGLWTVWVALVASAAGGYIAGRMRQRWQDATEQEVEFRDGVHGLVVWGMATIAAAIGIALIGALEAVGAALTGSGANDSAEANVLRARENISVIFSFATASGSLLGAAAAWWMATLGGEHRDEGVDVHAMVPAVLRRR